MKIIVNEIVSALLMSFIITVIVLLNIPKEVYSTVDYKKRPIVIGIKTFILSFGATYVLLYFISDPKPNDVFKNVIQGDPDF